MEHDRVFDTSALITFLENESGAEEVADLITRTSDAKRQRLICVVNLGEVWHDVARKRKDADRIVNVLLELNFTVVDVDWALARQAAEFKTHYKMGFADCYAAALAKLRNVELVTRDADFKKLERVVKVRLLKSK